MHIETKTKEQHLALVKVLYALGATYHDEATPEAAVARYTFGRYPTLHVDVSANGIRLIAGKYGGTGIPLDSAFTNAVLAYLQKLGTKAPTVVKITGNYSATINDKTTVVGCQFFDNKDILALAAEIKKQSPKPAVYAKKLVF